MPEPTLTITDARIKFILSLGTVIALVYGASDYINDKIDRLEALERLSLIQKTQMVELTKEMQNVRVASNNEVEKLEDEIRILSRDLQIHLIRHEQQHRD